MTDGILYSKSFYTQQHESHIYKSHFFVLLNVIILNSMTAANRLENTRSYFCQKLVEKSR